MDVPQLAEHIIPSPPSMQPEKRPHPDKGPDEASPVPRKLAKMKGKGRESPPDSNMIDSTPHSPQKIKPSDTPRNKDKSDVSTSNSAVTELSFRTWLEPNEERSIPPPESMLRREPSSSSSPFNGPPDHLQDIRF